MHVSIALQLKGKRPGCITARIALAWHSSCLRPGQGKRTRRYTCPFWLREMRRREAIYRKEKSNVEEGGLSRRIECTADHGRSRSVFASLFKSNECGRR
jgi:hypothetical protein